MARLSATLASSRGEETAIIDDDGSLTWRDTLGAPPAVTKDDMPQGGWTETASMVHVDIEETIERIQLEVDRQNRL